MTASRVATAVVLLAALPTETSTAANHGAPPPVLAAAQRLVDPLYEVLRGLIDGQRVRALNLGVALPPLGPAAEDWDGVPVVARIADLLHFLLPRYRQENRSYLTIAVGCTGGRHRSVAVVERLALALESEGWISRAHHRDLDRGGT